MSITHAPTQTLTLRYLGFSRDTYGIVRGARQSSAPTLSSTRYIQGLAVLNNARKISDASLSSASFLGSITGVNTSYNDNFEHAQNDLISHLMSPHYPLAQRHEAVAKARKYGALKFLELHPLLNKEIDEFLSDIEIGEIEPARYFDDLRNVFRYIVVRVMRLHPEAHALEFADPFYFDVYQDAIHEKLAGKYSVKRVFKSLRIDGLRRMPIAWDEFDEEIPPQLISFLSDHGIAPERFERWRRSIIEHGYKEPLRDIHEAMHERLEKIAKDAWSPFMETQIARILGETGLTLDELRAWDKYNIYNPESAFANSRLKIQPQSDSPYARVYATLREVRELRYESTSRIRQKYMAAALQEEFGITVEQLIEGLNSWAHADERDTFFDEEIMKILMRASLVEHAESARTEAPGVVLETKQRVLRKQLMRLRDLTYLHADDLESDLGRLGRELFRLSTIPQNEIIDAEGAIYAVEVELRHILGNRFDTDVEQTWRRLRQLETIVEDNRDSLGPQYEKFRRWIDDLKTKPWRDKESRGMGALETALRVVLGDPVVDEALGMRMPPELRAPPPEAGPHPMDPFLELVEEYEDELGPLYKRWKMQLEALIESGRPIQDKDLQRWKTMLSRKLGADVVNDAL